MIKVFENIFGVLSAGIGMCVFVYSFLFLGDAGPDFIWICSVALGVTFAAVAAIFGAIDTYQKTGVKPSVSLADIKAYFFPSFEWDDEEEWDEE